MKETERIIPAKEHVYLDGPKSRGYEFKFILKTFMQFFTVHQKSAFCRALHYSFRIGQV